MLRRWSNGRGDRARRRSGLALVVAAAAVLTAACQPVTLGGPGAVIGNDVDPGSCPQHQPVPTAPCGPQPQVWAAINGPFARYDDGDPYSTQCAAGGGYGPSCTKGNPLYRTTGFNYVVDVTSADVGRPLTIEGYDIGTYPRTIGSGISMVQAQLDDVVATSGSTTITSASAPFTSAWSGQRISGLFCASSCTISTVVDATTVILNTTSTATGVFSAAIGADCNTSVPPFNAPSYSGMIPGNCQTGDVNDTAGQNIDVQVFDNDRSGAPSYASVLPGCDFARTATQLMAAFATYKNTWATLCQFVPTASGVYALRVRNSGIPGMVDRGQGTNAFALKVAGGTGTTLRPVDDAAIFVNAVGSRSIFYVADVPAASAGKKLVVDVYDPGDGGGTNPAVLQLRAPPGGAPSPTPTDTGLTVPAPGIATACSYNATPSPTIAPPTPDASTNCAVVTHLPAGTPGSSGVYNGAWLRFEVTLDPAYTCTTDCRWTMRYDWGSYGLPTDRMVFTAKVIG